MKRSSMLWQASAVSLAILMAGCSSTSWNRMSEADKGTAVGATGGAVAGAVVGGPVGAVAGAGIGAYAGNYAGAESGKPNAGEATMGRAAEAKSEGSMRTTAQNSVPPTTAPARTTSSAAPSDGMTSGNNGTTTNAMRDSPSTGATGSTSNLSAGASGTPRAPSGSSMNTGAQSTGMATDEGTIRSVQQALLRAGYDPGPIDGVMGPRTEQALARFQQSKGLSSTSSLDTQTLSALGVNP